MEQRKYPLAYGCKHRDLDIRMASRSGGVFTAVSDVVLENGGVVYGCALDESLRAVHRRATIKAERDAFRASKYVQSDMGSTFLSVKEDLDCGIEVLFSGTPCQVDGLKKYLSLTKTDGSKLLTVDIVCHGVPSPKLWRDYLAYQSKRHGRILAADFRNKREFGWEAHKETLQTAGGKTSADIFATLFYTNYPLRRSCHECQYTSMQRVADITLADFWGIDSLDPDFNDNKGVSLILVNTEEGAAFFDRAAESLEVREYPTDKIYQKSLNAPYFYNYKKEVFWREYRECGFEYIVKRYAKKTPIMKAVEKLAARLV